MTFQCRKIDDAKGPQISEAFLGDVRFGSFIDPNA